uniref:Transmembrane protein 45B n=1 Tax=Setaria italica TaxID=4555 RepID=K3YM95_SETIT
MLFLSQLLTMQHYLSQVTTLNQHYLFKPCGLAMGTFLGHFLPGLAFAILGVWHTLNTVRDYKLRGASGFRSATWFPFPSPLPWLRRLELYLLLSFSVLAIIDQLVDLPILALCLQPDSLEHATIYLHLAVYASVALAADVSGRRDDAAGVGGVVAALAASVFGQELFLLRFHSADHAGLEGHYHWLLQLVVAGSLAATAATAVLPGSFAVAVVRSASVLLQGVWFMAMGFALWVPALVPSGCHGVGVEEEGSSAAMRSAVACATEEAARRATVMANLQFSWALAAVWVVTAYLCLRVDSGCLEYVQLQAPPSGVLAGDGDTPRKIVFPVEEQV